VITYPYAFVPPFPHCDGGPGRNQRLLLPAGRPRRSLTHGRVPEHSPSLLRCPSNAHDATPCEVCGSAIQGGRVAHAPTCQSERWRRQQEAISRDGDARLVVLLREAIELLEESS
jgi:hypothetical protein